MRPTMKKLQTVIKKNVAFFLGATLFGVAMVVFVRLSQLENIQSTSSDNRGPQLFKAIRPAESSDCNQLQAPSNFGEGVGTDLLALVGDLKVSDIPSYPQVKFVSYQTQDDDIWGGYRSRRGNNSAGFSAEPRQLNSGQGVAQAKPINTPFGMRSQLIEKVDYASQNHSYAQEGQPFTSPSSIYQSFSNHHSECDCMECDSYFEQHKRILAVDDYRRFPGIEPKWRHAEMLPWESMAYGEYIGPPRTPHVKEYRARVNDQIDFVYRRTRNRTSEAYRLGVGDTLAISSVPIDLNIEDPLLTILQDGTIQVRGVGNVLAANKTIVQLQDELNQLFMEKADLRENPKVIVKPIQTETRLQDLIRTVDATAGQGGLGRAVSVSPDGTVQLPGIGSVPAIGLTLSELSDETNSRYAMDVQGLEVTAILRQRAPRFVFVVGEVPAAGQIELTGPTTVMQIIARAGGWNPGGNLREIVIFRRDKDWRLIATKVDLSGAFWGRRPQPSDDLWLRDSDIVLIPKTPGQRIADFVEIYFTRGLYGVLPSQGFAVRFDGVSAL